MLAQLGSVVFELLRAPLKFEKRKTVEFAEHRIVNRKTRLQYTGTNTDEVTLTVRFHSMFCDPAREMQELEKIAEAAEPVVFVLGTGEILGDFVITEITETVTQTDRVGYPISIEAEIKLREYVKRTGEQ